MKFVSPQPPVYDTKAPMKVLERNYGSSWESRELGVHKTPLSQRYPLSAIPFFPSGIVWSLRPSSKRKIVTSCVEAINGPFIQTRNFPVSKSVKSYPRPAS